MVRAACLAFLLLPVVALGEGSSSDAEPWCSGNANECSLTCYKNTIPAPGGRISCWLGTGIGGFRAGVIYCNRGGTIGRMKGSSDTVANAPFTGESFDTFAVEHGNGCPAETEAAAACESALTTAAATAEAVCSYVISGVRFRYVQHGSSCSLTCSGRAAEQTDQCEGTCTHFTQVILNGHCERP